jgi:Baseplate J-like protein
VVVQYHCKNEQRRIQVREKKGVDGRFLNGIDYLEVSADGKTLSVYFIHSLPGQENGVPLTPVLNELNVEIVGGTRLRNIQVQSISAWANVLTVKTQEKGDLSIYLLRLVSSKATSEQPGGFDPQLSQIEFSFRVETESEFDCQPSPIPAPKPQPVPVIDYLAKDYASFRQLMLDRLSTIAPQWLERNPSDIGIMLVEALAYAADHLSYYQDAIATEAYLNTARKRVSVRRHARLLDYFMHDGCNARAWVAIEVSPAWKQGIKISGPSLQNHHPGTQFFTKVPGLNPVLQSFDDLRTALNGGAQVFEAMHDITLHSELNKLEFYTWGNTECYLPKEATEATLNDPDGKLQKYLVPGDVLILEEVKGVKSGEAPDADANYRHAVRLTSVQSTRDPLLGNYLLEVEWSADDALPFPLVISTVINDREVVNVSVARGNVVLVDHGFTVFNVDRQGRMIFEEELPKVSNTDRYRPYLKRGSLTQQGQVLDRNNRLVAFDPQASAKAAGCWQLRDVRPNVWLREENHGQEFGWYPQYDLLNSDRFARDFVVETEDDGRAYLRFGDDVLGKRPEFPTDLRATYRFGNGKVGNVGAEAIHHVFLHNSAIVDGITQIRNPLPAGGGQELESIEKVRLLAPQGFRVQQRAVTTADYAEITERFPGVQKAVATRRWTGSWYTIFITVDRQGGRRVDEQFQERLRAFLERFRLAGHDLAINDPQFIALDIAMNVRVAPDYFRSSVKAALLETFNNTLLSDGQLGFFSPDRFSFGQPVYLSQVIARAMQVSGVESLKVNRLQRWGQPANNELQSGEITFAPLEIARLNNDPNVPENGRIEFDLEGGL